MKLGSRDAAAVPATLLACLISIKVVLAFAARFGFSPQHFEDPAFVLDPLTIAAVLAVLLAPVLIVLGAQRFLHRRSIAELGLRGPWVSPFGAGAAIGAIVKLAAISAAVAFSHQARISPVAAPAGISAWLPYFLWYLFALFLNCVSEELVYRAYPISTLKGIPRLPVGAVIAAAAAIFSLMHFLIEPPDASRFLYRFAFGIATGLLFARQGTLAGVVGLHLGFNFVALSFSGGNWRLGSLFAVVGLGSRTEALANMAALSALSIGISLVDRVAVRRI